MKQYCRRGHDINQVGRDKGGHCKACEKIGNKDRGRRPLYKAIAKRNKLQRRQKRKALVDQLKSGPCMDCSISYPPYVMDFDHRPDQVKAFDVSDFTRGVITVEKLECIYKEIAKCDLVCANCHRERTHSRQVK